jgi:hypothetical protein
MLIGAADHVGPIGRGVGQSDGHTMPRRVTTLVRAPRSELLRGVVTRLGYSRSGEGGYRIEAIMPTARTNVMVDLSGVAFRTYDGDGASARVHGGVIVAGPMTEPMWVGLEARNTVWADLAPAAAPAVLGPPASELHHVIDLNDVWGCDAAWLREQLAAADSPEAALGILEEALLAHLRSDLLSSAICFAAHSLSNTRSRGDA